MDPEKAKIALRIEISSGKTIIAKLTTTDNKKGIL
jgi:hypothetical protein